MGLFATWPPGAKAASETGYKKFNYIVSLFESLQPQLIVADVIDKASRYDISKVFLTLLTVNMFTL